MSQDADANWFPLTKAQEQVWLAQELYPENTSYNMGESVIIEGSVDTELFKEALQSCIHRFETLRIQIRTTFENGGIPVPEQRVRDIADWHLDEKIFESGWDEALDYMESDLRIPRDLYDDTLFKFGLYKISENRYVWYQYIHHIAADAYSFASITKHVAKHYNAAFERVALSNDGSIIGTMKDIVQEDSLYSGSATEEKDRNYWSNLLSGWGDPTVFSTNICPPSSTSESSLTRVTESQFEKITQLAARNNCKWPVVLTAVSAAFTFLATGNRDVVLSMPVGTRKTRKYRETPSMLSDSLPIRLIISPSQSISDILRKAKGELREQNKHQRFSASSLKEIVPIEAGRREWGPRLNLIPFGWPSQMGSAPIRAHNLSLGPVEDISISVFHRTKSDGLTIYFESNPDAHTRESAIALRELFFRVLEQAISDDEQLIGNYQTYQKTDSVGDLERLVGEKAGLPSSSIVDQIESQARKYPDRTAVEFGDRAETYCGLNRKANRLARLMLDRGAKPGSTIPVTAERSIEFVVVMLAAAKIGASYLPIDTDLPDKRISSMLANASFELGIAPKATVDMLPIPKSGWITFEEVAEGGIANNSYYADDLSTSELHPDCNADSPLYIMHTSGTSGEPKGVVFPRSGLINLNSWQYRQIDSVEGGSSLQFTSLSFDVSAQELLFSLANARTVILAPQELRNDPASFVTEMRDRGVDMLFAPNVILQEIFSEANQRDIALPKLKHVIQAGEQLVISDDVSKFFSENPGATLHNQYGPTESHVATNYTFSNELSEWPQKAPIGRPISNVECYVLDGVLNPVIPGKPGELYIGGSQLAIGYLSKPALTSQRFIPNPFGKPGSRMYRTGDVVTVDSYGRLNFEGRADSQVKIRGFRVELGEVETVLSRHSLVRQAVVALSGDLDGLKKLHAFVVPADGASIDISDVRQWLKDRLPSYAIPDFFVESTRIPHTSNGKIDYNALLEHGKKQLVEENEISPPSGMQERQFLKIFRRVLKVENVGIDDDFFSLGGDSITVIQLVRESRREGFAISAENIYRNRTVRRICTIIEDDHGPTEEIAGAGVGEVPLTPIIEWFRSRKTGYSRYCQYMIIQTPVDCTKSAIESVLFLLVERHDVLRMQIDSFESSQWKIETSPSDEPRPVPCARVDGTEIPNDRLTAVAELKKDEAFSSLSPEDGVNLSAIWVDAGAGRSGRLLLAIHHLAVDGVSWRILLPELEELYAGVSRGEKVVLPKIGTSFRTWASQLCSPSSIQQRRGESAFWSSVLEKEAERSSSPFELDESRDIYHTEEAMVSKLSQEVSNKLISRTPNGLGVGINSILLTALMAAFQDWGDSEFPGFDGGTPLMNLESHGRETLGRDMDLSQTIGWFTSMYPVRLVLNEGSFDKVEKAVTAAHFIEDQLAEVEDNGVGYGILKYVDSGTELPSYEPKVSFNYLGRFDSPAEKDWSPSVDSEGFGGGSSPEMPLAHGLEIHCITRDFENGPVFQVLWRWAGRVFKREQIQVLADSWFSKLDDLVSVADELTRRGLSGDELSLSNWEFDEYIDFVDQFGLE